MKVINFPKAILKDDSRGRGTKKLTLVELRQAAYLVAMQGKIKVGDIITYRNDAKTVRGLKYGVDTGVLYMAPADVSGYILCSHMTPGCKAACLFTAGQGRFPNVKQGRLRRTYQWLFRREEFLTTLAKEIVKYGGIAASEGLVLAIRLNGTSDVYWENFPVTLPSGEVAENIFAAFPDVTFYDYTKCLDRLDAIAAIPNYDITFSRGETTKSQKDALVALSKGVNVTVVFRDELPPMWDGHVVVDGDRHDARFLDKIKASGDPVIIGLLAKGDAKTDYTGFVVDLDD